MKDRTVYNVDIIQLIEKLKEIYKLGHDGINITIITDSVISVNPYTPEIKQLPPTGDNILNYI